MERLFLVVAGLRVDKADLRRYEVFLDAKISDLLKRGCEVAQDAGRRVIRANDIPITKGLAACIDEFNRLDEELRLVPLVEHLGRKLQLDLAYDSDTLGRLPELAGGMTIALAISFKILEPELHSIATVHWERAFRLFDLVW